MVDDGQADRRLVINCIVKSFNSDQTLTASCSEQDSVTARDRTFSYRFEGLAVFLDDQRLQMVPHQIVRTVSGNRGCTRCTGGRDFSR